nr:MAG TPA: hypothetical protein [Caudoviricetes sp.]
MLLSFLFCCSRGRTTFWFGTSEPSAELIGFLDIETRKT